MIEPVRRLNQREAGADGRPGETGAVSSRAVMERLLRQGLLFSPALNEPAPGRRRLAVHPPKGAAERFFAAEAHGEGDVAGFAVRVAKQDRRLFQAPAPAILHRRLAYLRRETLSRSEER